MTEQEERDHKAVRLGSQAEQVLKNPAWEFAWKTVQETLTLERRKIETKPERAEYLRMVEIGVAKAQVLLEETMRQGRFAAESIRQEQERKSWLERVVKRA